MLLAVPFGLGAAIFVSEFCGPRMRETLKIVIELLAAHSQRGVGLHRR